METKLVNMRLSVDLLARVDAAAGPRKRTEFVERALEKALDGEGRSTMPAPSRAPKKDRLTEAQSVLARAQWSSAHRPTCSCSMCKPPKR